MYFLIQSNIYSDPDHNRIYDVLDELNYPYETIEVLKETKHLKLNTNRQDIFVYGSVRLARLALQYTDWKPNSFYGNNHLFEIYSKHYKDHVLNYEFQVMKLTDNIDWTTNTQLFIKPFRDAKVFTGQVFNKHTWSDYVYEALASKRSENLNENTLIQISKPQDIRKEARLWIVGEQIIDAGYYKFNENSAFELNVPPEGIQFAKQMISLFNIADAFVMDIGLTHNGWKIVEINCINSSGFYPNTNIKAIFKALFTYFTINKTYI
ncbi:ATP-grasp domain-containing protein [uncultured Psychroserpens sp.]|uniref:ATP-grasp domain-containing protein n=1 Tax=uncultured Psychroserpens sp. TaxID=255436 RepID=UPI002622CDB5|nr:ATP-grasp domain-containing protein [uncultured Psychroserpens sp.]